MTVLGVSGSPVENSNTDRAVKAVLAASGRPYEFVKLRDLTLAPCLACLGCVSTGVCVIKDDGVELAERVRTAEALVVGGFTPYSSLDARTKAFLERMYPLRHDRGSNKGKPGVAVVTAAVPAGVEGLPPACQMGVSAIQFYMMEEEMKFLGAVEIVGNVPCIRCGKGDTCKTSGVKMIFGPEATVDSVGVKRFEEQPISLDAAKELGRKLGEALDQ